MMDECEAAPSAPSQDSLDGQQGPSQHVAGSLDLLLYPPAVATAPDADTFEITSNAKGKTEDKALPILPGCWLT